MGKVSRSAESVDRAVMQRNKHPQDRHAALGVWCAGLLYALHCGYVILMIEPVNDRAARMLPVFGIIAGAMLFLFVWAGLAVRRGGRLLGASLLIALFIAASALSAPLAANTMWDGHAPFVVLQIVNVFAGICVLGLLARAMSARTARQAKARPGDIERTDRTV